MSIKNRDNQGRWRSKTIAFRVSPEENELLNNMVRLSGLSKQEYLTSNMLGASITVTGNPKVYRALKTEMSEIKNELSRLSLIEEVPADTMRLLERVVEIYEEMKISGGNNND